MIETPVSPAVPTQALRPARPFRAVTIGGLIGLVFGCFLLDITLGSLRIPFVQVGKILLGQPTDNTAWIYIIQKIRLPKAITAIVVGCGLSVSGLQMQTLFRNPLAGPSVLGITGGAGLGVALVILSTGGVTSLNTIRQLGLSGSWLLVVMASLGAALVMLLVLLIAGRIRSNVVMLIVGVMIGNITLSVISIWQYFSRPEQLQEYLIWTFGSLGGVTQSHLYVLTGVVGVGLVLAFSSSKSLNALLLGENYARSMGLAVGRSRVFIIASTSLLTGGITAFCGPIGFIGLAVPHLTRSLLNTTDHRILIPGTCLVGMVLMLLCDCLAQMPGSQSVLPINVVTALIGSPVVIWIIVRRHAKTGAIS